MKRSIKKEILDQLQSEYKKIEEVNISSIMFDDCYKILSGKYLLFISDDVKKENIDEIVSSLSSLGGDAPTKGATFLLVGETAQSFEKGDLTAKNEDGLKANFLLIKDESTIFVHKPMSLIPIIGLRGVIESILAHYNFMNVELC